MPEPFILPPLNHRPIQRKGRVEGWLDEALTGDAHLRASKQRASWWWIIGRWLLYILAIVMLVITPLDEHVGIFRWLAELCGLALALSYFHPRFGHWLASCTMHFGRTFPYVLRPWYSVCKFMRSRLAKVKFETKHTIYLRRLFSLERHDGRFNPRHALLNWVTVLFLMYVFPLDGIYAYVTYTWGTYHDIVVTQAYRNISDQNTYAVHGYKLIDGVKHEYYFELGPNLWFWQLYPEYMFGQLPVLGRCTFDTYGVTLRIPQRLRLFAAGSLYALNPWIVSIQCTAPSIVPDKA